MDDLLRFDSMGLQCHNHNNQPILKLEVTVPKKATAHKCTCQRCDYTWTARAKEPKECPKCKSRLWNVSR